MKSSKTTARRDSLRGACVSFLTVALLATTVVPQETTLRSQANVVLVPALVKDSAGKIVYGLLPKDFRIEDDGVEQAIRLDEAPDGQPVSLVLAIQRGRRASYEFPRLKGLKTMLEPLFALGTARVAVVEFDNQVTLTRNFTHDESLIDADLSTIQAGDEGAPILDAVEYSVGLLKQEPPERQRVLLLVSETRDHGSHTKIEHAVAAIDDSNVTIYALAFSPGLSNILDTGRGTNINEMHEGVNFLDLGYQIAQGMRKNVAQTVASMTGGEYELFLTRKKFEVRMTDFTNHLHSRYLLSFAPNNPHPGLHRIQVKLKDPANTTILARSGYWVDGKK
jgi:VWFA-related protein